MSGRCHDEQANFLALNLMHDIVRGDRHAQDARDYYAEEFMNVRHKRPTPDMDQLRFRPGRNTEHLDHRVLSDEDLESAAPEAETA